MDYLWSVRKEKLFLADVNVFSLFSILVATTRFITIDTQLRWTVLASSVSICLFLEGKFMIFYPILLKWPCAEALCRALSLKPVNGLFKKLHPVSKRRQDLISISSNFSFWFQRLHLSLFEQQFLLRFSIFLNASCLVIIDKWFKQPSQTSLQIVICFSIFLPNINLQRFFVLFTSTRHRKVIAASQHCLRIKLLLSQLYWHPNLP